MMNHKKYQKSYYMPPEECNEWVKKDHIDKAPIWCSVDLRDGNQALVVPMDLEKKLEYFKLLVDIGFKEIEVGFPAASDTEYRFMRELVERDLIPEDVTVQVLTQSREHIIRKTFEAVRGVRKAVIHLYNSTSVAQREQVFGKTKEEVKAIAIEGAKLFKELEKETEGDFTFEYSPESFPGTEVDYALEVCNAVLGVWRPSANRKAIINIPTTVENAMPHVFASQVEYMSKNLKYRKNVILSLHPHNDRGCGISDAELGILAGADRVEGTLFGNGERTGNADVVTLAMNLYSHGIDPGLDFSDMPQICKKYEEFTNMTIDARQPYAGELVFAAFSGSHQDAIAKGMRWKDEKESEWWNVPYLPIDPNDVGREYETDVIRINSQSGKGGVGYVLEQNYGIQMPKAMKEAMGYLAKGVSDKENQELTPERIYRIFKDAYIKNRSQFDLVSCHYKQEDGVVAKVAVKAGDETVTVKGKGKGRLEAVNKALMKYTQKDYELTCYEEHALTRGDSSKAIAYVGLTMGGKNYWGAGVDEDIVKASINALVSAINDLD